MTMPVIRVYCSPAVCTLCTVRSHQLSVPHPRPPSKKKNKREILYLEKVCSKRLCAQPDFPIFFFGKNLNCWQWEYMDVSMKKPWSGFPSHSLIETKTTLYVLWSFSLFFVFNLCKQIFQKVSLPCTF